MMGKKHEIEELANIIAIGLRHRIGSIVNKTEIYAAKYAEDADKFFTEAEKAAKSRTWNLTDKEIIKEKIKRKLKNELEKSEFIANRKFDIMEEEIGKILRRLKLNLI